MLTGNLLSMPTIGTVPFLDTEMRSLSGATPCCAFVAFLDNPATKDATYRDAETRTWTVQCKKDSKVVVARCSVNISEQELGKDGREMIKRFLDFWAIAHPKEAYIPIDLEKNVSVFLRDDERILRVFDASRFDINFEFTLSGAVAGQPHVWRPAYRYYRLALSSPNLTDAYRNLWLAFELWLDEFFPKPPNIREGEWVQDALRKLAGLKDFGLERFAPHGHREPASYIFGCQYEFVRNNLFHSKRDPKSRLIRPVEPHDILRHFRDLRRLVNAAFYWNYKLTPNTGTEYSPEVFWGMTNAVLTGSQICLSVMSTSGEEHNSHKVDETNLVEIVFDETKFLKHTDSVSATLVGRTRVTDEYRSLPITKIYGSYKDQPGVIADIPEPITLGFVSVMEAIFLFQRSDNLAPATAFRTEGIHDAVAWKDHT
jgi:hypothetical protein